LSAESNRVDISHWHLACRLGFHRLFTSGAKRLPFPFHFHLAGLLCARACVRVCVAGLKRVGGIQFIFIYCEQMVGLMELPAENRKQQKAEFFWKYFL